MAITTEKIYSLKIEGEQSVDDLRKAIEQLNDKLKTLNDTSKDYQETLKQITEYQDRLKDAMNGLGESVSSANTFVEEFTQGFVEGMMEAAESSDAFQDSVMEDATSVGELRSQIKELQDRLVKLDSSTDAYKKTLEVLTAKNQKLQEVMAATKNTVTAAAGSYNALSQELSALRKQWKATSDEAERARIGEKMKDINQQLKEMDASIGNYQRNVGNYANSMTNVFGNPRKEIRELREQLAHLTIGSEEYNQVLLRMADLTQQQRHFQDQLKFSSANLEDIFSNMTGVARGVAGGFSAINAAMGLMGNQNGDLQKAMLKTQQLMALVQGLSGLEGLKDRIVGLIDGIKGFTSRMTTLNKNTKDFNETTKVTATEAERATGALDSQAGATEKLASIQERLSESERESIGIIQREIDERKAKIAVLQQEYSELEKSTNSRAWNDFSQASKDEFKRREEILDEIEALTKEIDAREKSRKSIEDEAIARNENISSVEKEILAIDEHISTLNKEIESEQTELDFVQDAVEFNKEMVESLEERIAAGEELNDVEKEQLEQAKDLQMTAESEVEQRKEYIAVRKQEIVQLQKEKTIKEQALATQQKLTAQLQTYQKWQVLSVAQTRLQIFESKQLVKAQMAEIAGQKGLASAYNTTAIAARIASVAIKGVKAALVSSGIGLIIVAITTAIGLLSDTIGALWDRITGNGEINHQIDIMNTKIKELNKELELTNKYLDAFGATDFKKQINEITKLKEISEKAKEALDFSTAADASKDKIEELRKQWYESQDTLDGSIDNAMLMIDKLVFTVEKADRQKGMTQLEKDLEETNKQFEDAIALVTMFGEIGIWSTEQVDAKIKVLNETLAKQKQLIIDRNKEDKKTKSDDSERKEAERLYKETLDYYKKEEQLLKEKYEKEKALLEKYHKDTTALTRKYNEDLHKIVVERQKLEYESWVEHLNAVLSLEESNTEKYMKKNIDNLKKIFSEDFGADWENPLETFFSEQILENGGKALSITEDIRETMERMDLNPESIDDIQKMIDKWKLDKKAIEDAERALADFVSQQKMLRYETASSKMSEEFDKVLSDIELKYSKLESKSSSIIKGFYSGISPEQMQQEFNERYDAMEIEIQREIELWTKAANDQTLTLEDRNKAVDNLNKALAKKETTAVQKQIDANNLLIQSYQRVSDALSSMASNLASILGSVSDAILSNAEAQREAGKISQEEYEKQFEQAKAYQIAQATINTIAGAVGAFMGITKDTGGWGIAAAAIEAAAVLAAGFAQIAQIQSTQPSKNGSSSSSSGGANGFTLPSVMVSEPEYQQSLTNQSDIDALANALGGKLGDQRVVLVESDVTIAQGKARKVDVETKF